MAHFAQLDENNLVSRVIVVDNSDTSDVNGVELESIGVAFCQKLFGVDTNWKQTSYNDKIRVRYAGIGYSYNAELDAFVPPKPHPSWTLDNSTADWVSPAGAAPALTDEEMGAGKAYVWNEETTAWVLISR